MTHRASRGLAVLAVGVGCLVAVTTAGAQAPTRTWTSTYDWPGGDGFGGWGSFELSPPPPVAPGPYYRALFGTSGRGAGIVFEPLGGRRYDNGDPTSEEGGPRIVGQLDAPGTTSIRSARFDGVDFLNDREGQGLRMAIYGTAYDDVVDLVPPTYAPGVEYQDRGPFTVGPAPDATPASSVQLWLFTICAPDTVGGPPTCPVVAAPSASYGRVEEVTVTFNDTDVPQLAIGGPLVERLWRRGTASETLDTTVSDAGSGVARIAVSARSPGRAPRTVFDHAVPCDVDHVTPQPPGRDAAVCPATAGRQASEALGTLPEGITRYTVTGEDLSGQTASREFDVGVDRHPPTVNARGGLLSLSTRWQAVRRVVTTTVDARDALSGVAAGRLIVIGPGGRRVEVADPVPCPATARECPRARTATLALDLAELPDGEHRVTVVATDLAGNTSAPRTVKRLRLDRTGPTPARLTVSGNARTARASWSGARDPRPGSGLDGYLVRSRRGSGAWSRRLQTRSPRAQRAGVRDGDAVEFEVVAVDRAGNQSEPVRVRATVGRGPVTSRPRTGCARPGSNCRSSSRGRVQTLQAKAKKKGLRCPIFIYNNLPAKPVTADPVQFVAANIRPQFRYKIGYSNRPEGSPNSIGQSCGLPDPVLNGPTDLIVEATLQMQLRVDSVRGEILNRNVNLTYVSKFADTYERQADFGCRPATDGNTRVDGNGNGVRRVTLRLLGLQGTTFITDKTTRPQDRIRTIIPGERSYSFLVRCPSTTQRRDNELAAWRELWPYNPVTRNPPRAGDPKDAARDILRSALIKGIPTKVKPTPWEAHHIIPIAEQPADRAGYEAYRLVVPGAFRCHLYPNEVLNGVFLRQRDWQRGTDRWRALPPRARLRTWHPLTTGRTFGGPYFQRLARSLSGTLSREGECTNDGSFARRMRAVKRALTLGVYIPRGQEPRGG